MSDYAKPQYPVKLRDDAGHMHGRLDVVEVDNGRTVSSYGSLRSGAVMGYVNDARLLEQFIASVKELGHKYKDQGIAKAVELAKDIERQRWFT